MIFPKMKIVQPYEGSRSFPVEEWANFVSIDPDGETVQHEYKPKLGRNSWIPPIKSKCDFVIYVTLEDGEDWRDTLRKV